MILAGEILQREVASGRNKLLGLHQRHASFGDDLQREADRDSQAPDLSGFFIDLFARRERGGALLQGFH